MSCICQYIAGSLASMNDNEEPIGFPLPNTNENDAMSAPGNASAEPVTDDAKISICVSEMADCRAENWLLKKKVEEHETTIQNLEHLLTTVMDKQHQMLADVFQLRQRNQELQTECNLQREYHTMERNALVKELCHLKCLHMYEQGNDEHDSSDSDGREDEDEKPLETDEEEYSEDEEIGSEDELSVDSSGDSTASSSALSSPDDSLCSCDSDSGEREDDDELDSLNEIEDSTESESD
ncbi:hypothetical protein AWZ03_004427 [Drosophila navojoa]|uniref:Uncharacterized protein n=1 Tax=Drosophila navojoa TaxID=7232 RepID=A0A484BK15_DRONA|nr:uncharacterized protein LOC108653119 [Drosophila navojoa]TDG49127.1 hypothetical protein AWZ03_004427 [Drosophila navojoa]